MHNQSLVFGEVAELYDRIRPSYPPGLVQDVLSVARHASPTIVEVGAGTAKATILFAPYAKHLLALEPSPEMASIGARKCTRWSNVTFEIVSFEEWQPQSTFDLLISGQAWHWTDQQMRYVKAHQALTSRGLLAIFSYRPNWEQESLRQDLIHVYDQHAPHLKAHAFPNLNPPSIEQQRALCSEVDRSELFVTLDEHLYESIVTYSTSEYVDLLCTQSNHRMLPQEGRSDLLSDVAQVLDRGGGSIQMRYTTRLCLALRKRRSSDLGSEG